MGGLRRFFNILAACSIVAGSCFTAFAQNEKRVALVIGNGNYNNTAPLKNPKNDAQDVAAALKRSGFDTVVGFDLDKAGMEETAVRFARLARDADVAMFYYAGHAMQFAGVNYLMPVDAKLIDEADLRRMARLDDIVSDLQQAKILRILVLDSCRDNPLAEELKRSIGLTRGTAVQRGLAKIDSPRGMIVAYATQAGRTADDGSERNSPFTTAFLKHIETQDEIGTVFRRISADVYHATKRTQLPELSLSLIGEFFLRGKPITPVAVPPGVPKAVANESPKKEEPKPAPAIAADEVLWSTIKESTVPILFEEFLKMFPESSKKSQAQARLEGLNKVTAIIPPRQSPKASELIIQPAVGIYPDLNLKVLTAESERSLKPKEHFRECGKCPEMVVIPAGEFTMGSPASEPERESSEGPQHRMTISIPFAAGRFAVTFEEWDACVAAGGCKGYRPWDNNWGRGRRPVINVSWDDAKTYVAWLSQVTGKSYRLLTEAEREYVTRAGTTTPFWWGKSVTPGQANYNGQIAYAGGGKGENRQKTTSAETFEPNPWGLYQVHGNVWEWIEDCLNQDYKDAPSNSSPWTSGDCSRRVLRGGSWTSDPAHLRAAARYGISAEGRVGNVGFRVARSLK